MTRACFVCGLTVVEAWVCACGEVICAHPAHWMLPGWDTYRFPHEPSLHGTRSERLRMDAAAAAAGETLFDEDDEALEAGGITPPVPQGSAR